METKRPQLSRDELHQLKWLLGGSLVLLSVWSVLYLDFDTWTLTGVTTLAVLAALLRPGWPARVPAWVHRLVFPGVVAFFLGDLWITGEVLPAIVRLDLLLLLYRGVTYRKKRDDLQIIVLGLFLIVVAGVLTVSLVFAGQILVFTACALAFLLVITLLESIEAGRAGDAPGAAPSWVHVRWRDLFARVRAVVDWRIAALGGALFLGVVVMSALLFLAIPRFQLENSLFLERFVSKKARSGFNETIKFGEVTEILQDNSLAMSVDVSDRAQIPSTPYWRMLVLDEYRGGSFRLSPIQRRKFANERTDWMCQGGARPRVGAAVTWTFYLESGISRYLPLLGDFELLRFQEKQNFRTFRSAGLVMLREEPVTMTAYRVEGMLTGDMFPDPRFELLLNEPPSTNVLAADFVRMLTLGVAGNDAVAVRRAVQEITGGKTLPASEFVRRATRWLGERHGYTLAPKIPGGPGDALVRWLVSEERGNCELFAGSFVLLSRAAGFPTRVVTGFKGGTWNAYSNNFTVRNTNAHAWCEMFDRTAGAWRRVDPTASAGTGVSPDEAMSDVAQARRTDRSWSARLESLRVMWYRRIVNFDQSSQVETLRAMKAATQNSGRRLRAAIVDFLARSKAWFSSPWDTRRISTVAGMAGLVFAATLGLRRFGRGWWRLVRGGRRSGGDPVRREAGKWLERIARVDAQGVDEPTIKADLQRLRYGARETWIAPERVFRRARVALKSRRKRL